MRTRLHSVLRWIIFEPLVHFVALGATVFVTFYALHPAGLRQNERIEITTVDLERLRATSLRQWGKDPDARQLQDLVQAQVREEVLVREAVASGLDRDDIIVRRRLAQKMEFLAHEAVSAPIEPELRLYYAAHAAQYQQSARVDFEHIYFSADRSGEPAVHAARQAHEALARGVPSAGDNFMLGNTLKLQERESLARDFGAPFADAVFGLPQGAWSAPTASAQGQHLVRVLQRYEPQTLAFEAVRERVAADMVNTRVAAARDASFRRLLARYTVVLPNDPLQVSAETAVAARP